MRLDIGNRKKNTEKKEMRMSIQNAVKHLTWSFSRK